MIGKEIHHYKILEKLGEGGMGVVYKAQDTKLDRIVALKFLPTHSLGNDDDRKRFETEAKAAAALNHPNIATVYEINDHEGDTFIAMEFVDGDTLEDKIKKAPLKIKEAMKIAKQVSDGLAAAHEKGITHRDIKGSNVMVTAKGVVKIMDFGLAKMSSATIVTKAGMTLGTVGYMSPEQSKGEEVDHRTDIWSLGVVFYEMIAGVRPFKGEYETALVYSILNVDPEPLTGLRTGVPMDLEKIINKLLAKDPDERYQNVIELPVDLKNVNLKDVGTSQVDSSVITQTDSTQREVSVKFKYSSNTILAVAAAIVITFGLTWILKPDPPVEQKFVEKFVHILPEGFNLGSTTGFGHHMNISPDGNNIVYNAIVDGATMLYLRSLGELGDIPLQGTEGARNPFFSPDSRWVGFFSNGEIKKVLLSGGSSRPIYKYGIDHRGASWTDDGNIIIAIPNIGIIKVPDSGGNPVTIIERDSTLADRYRWPEALPGGNAFLYTVTNGVLADTDIALHVIGEENSTVLIQGGTGPRYSPSGHILFGRSGSFWAVPFDIDNLELTGDAIPVVEDVAIHNGGAVNFNISDNGRIAYRSIGIVEGGLLPELRKIPDSGQPLDEEFSQGFSNEFYLFPKISPDSKYAAFTIRSREGDMESIWRYDIERKNLTPLIVDNNFNWVVDWSPDGNKILFTRYVDIRSTINRNLYTINSDGTGDSEVVVDHEFRINYGNYSSDGKFIVHDLQSPETNWDIWVFNSETGSSTPLISTVNNEQYPVFMPDNTWIAYASDKSGVLEIYLTQYSGTGREEPVSLQGGSGPVWSPDGKKLYYYGSTENAIMSVSIETDPDLIIGIPVPVLNYSDYLLDQFPEYDIHPDGDKILVIRDLINSESGIMIFNNFFEVLKTVLPDNRK